MYFIMNLNIILNNIKLPILCSIELLSLSIQTHLKYDFLAYFYKFIMVRSHAYIHIHHQNISHCIQFHLDNVA